MGREIIGKIHETLGKLPPQHLKLLRYQDVKQRINHGAVLIESCLLRGIPSTSSNTSSSECLLSLIIDEPCKHVKEDNINNHVLRWQDLTPRSALQARERET